MSFFACLDNMVQRWKEGAALRWLNPASVQHLIALFEALAICRSASRVSFCKRPAHTSRQVLLLVTRMNKIVIRNKENPELKSLSYASKRCTPAHCIHVLYTSTKHSPPAGVLFASPVPPVRVAPTVSPCLFHGLAALLLSFSYVFCMGVSWHRGSSGLFSRARAHTQSLEWLRPAPLCAFRRWPVASRQQLSPLAAVAASAFAKVGACCPYRSVALRAPFLVFPLSFPCPVRLDWYAVDLSTVKITLFTLFVPSKGLVVGHFARSTRKPSELSGAKATTSRAASTSWS